MQLCILAEVLGKRTLTKDISAFVISLHISAASLSVVIGFDDAVELTLKPMVVERSLRNVFMHAWRASSLA